MRYKPLLGAFSQSLPPPSETGFQDIIYERLEAIFLSELTENSGPVIKINNGVQSNFPSQRSGRLSCNQSLEVNSQGIWQVKSLAPPCAGLYLASSTRGIRKIYWCFQATENTQNPSSASNSHYLININYLSKNICITCFLNRKYLCTKCLHFSKRIYFLFPSYS